MSESTFARRMLEKQGWKEGDGLGRKRDGMSEPIKVNLKKDKTGVGHDPGLNFTDHWWLKVFNDAASSITKTKEVPEVKEKPSPVNKLYQGFRKGSTLTEGKEEKNSDCSSEDEDENQNASDIPTLDDIHKFCGGATGHRAATLGIKMKGKIQRATEQEIMFNEKSKNKDTTNEDSDLGSTGKRKKKKKDFEKRKCPQSDEMVELIDGFPSDKGSNDCGVDNADGVQVKSNERKKSKKKKRQREEKEQDNRDELSTECVEEPTMPKKKRKKSSRNNDENDLVNNSFQENVERSDRDERPKHKKKKKRRQHDD